MKKKAVFIDRDGVINRERNEYTFKIEDFEILDGVVESLKMLLSNGYLLFIISNQSGIAKGIYEHKDVDNIHKHLTEVLEKNGIKFTEIYYCPHHPDIGLCLCRKPDSLMLEKAVARFDIDVSQSCFIGDRERDIEAGEKVGIKGILVESNSSLRQIIGEVS